MIFICPALVNNYQKIYNLKFGPPSFGTTRISLAALQTLSTCDPNYSGNNPHDKLMINITLVASDEWPFGLPTTTNPARYPYSHNFNLNFHYSHSATVSLPYVSIPGFTRTQKAVIVKTSSCAASGGDAIQKHLVINGIPSLHGNCYANKYIVKFTTKRRKRYLSFIYKDTGSINLNSYLLDVVYHKCPTECRQYRYRTLVKGVDKNVVLEYTANVEQPTYVYPHHRGFKIMILTPKSLCSQHLQCELQVSAYTIRQKYQKKLANDNITRFHFFKTR